MTLGELIGQKGNRVVTINTGRTLKDAVDLMCSEKVGSVLVLDEQKIPAGIVTERDVLRMVCKDPVGMARIPVCDCMTTDLLVGTLEDDIHALMATMTERRFRHLPVVKDGRVLGIVSMGDLVKARLREASTEAHYLRDYVNGPYSSES